MGKGGGQGRGTARAAARASGGATAEGASTLETPSKATIKFDPDLTPAERQAQVRTLSNIVGKDLSHSEVGSLIGAPDNAKIGFLSVGDRSVTLVANFREGSAIRTIRKDLHGNLFIHNDEIVLGKEFQGKGLGPKIFAKQVHFAQKMGVKYIETLASREEGKYIGYKVWPKLGYDGVLPGLLARRVPAELGKVTHVRHLMATREGRDWWDKHGTNIDVRFDLTPGSYSQVTLKNYLKERGIK